MPDVLARHGVRFDGVLDAGRRLRDAAAYLELHIEQGPVLESMGLPLGVVTGTFAAERYEVTYGGQAAHAGSTPMHLRRDALAGAARLALATREVARAEGGVGTAGFIQARPGIPNIVPGSCALTLDLRHASAAALGRMLTACEDASRGIASEEKLSVEWRRLWRIDPIEFHPALVTMGEASAIEVSGGCHRMASGPLHDAAEMARAGIRPSCCSFRACAGSRTRRTRTPCPSISSSRCARSTGWPTAPWRRVADGQACAGAQARAPIRCRIDRERTGTWARIRA